MRAKIPNPFEIKIRKRPKHGEVGASPGTIRISPDALKPQITLFSYNKGFLKEEQSDDIDYMLSCGKERPEYIHWVQIKGIGDAELVKKIGSSLGLNSLVLEDITDTTQRPKYDEYDDFILAISRLLLLDGTNQVINTQFSILIKGNTLISFQETYDEPFEGLKSRLRGSKGILREEGTGYLLFALMDTLFDRYFVWLDKIEEHLENLENDINFKPKKKNLAETQRIRHMLIMLQRATSPERDKMNEILRSDNPLITPKVKVFFRDAYDHCIDIIETIGSFKELSTNLTEIYLSTVSNQMNDVMKILTIISSIFIPLTFIAGIYGMNFSATDPLTNKVLPNNMPELRQPHGYLYTLIVMAIIAIIQLVIFWKKGWFDKMK
ncbi:MAG: magnesium/cobalt transporter CorA [Bacteroidetes bacterium]|nr:magnesium/cobalt transporter CorA [Bacteroidota bacterium]